ncbi:hypothetical protein K6V25_12205 [Bacteroides salyersiae]|uniref:hypothetical protein n=1 Tax=Bacteroides salyersiae TaxID=291644 RepID=UPI001CCCB57C|nr:hypothetical protein [Bacteroides salyersiae]UBD63725.1 hypothetical protein K6V25_12205 [Bacteroides salyersiae]
MGKKELSPDKLMKILSKLQPKEKELPKVVPFDELLLKTMNVKPRKKKGKK